MEFGLLVTTQSQNFPSPFLFDFGLGWAPPWDLGLGLGLVNYLVMVLVDMLISTTRPRLSLLWWHWPKVDYARLGNINILGKLSDQRQSMTFIFRVMGGTDHTIITCVSKL